MQTNIKKNDLIIEKSGLLMYNKIEILDKEAILKIKKYRQEKKMTQSLLADLVGVKQNTISLWENGVVFPPLDKVFKMCDIFGCTIDDLVKEDKKMVSDHGGEG